MVMNNQDDWIKHTILKEKIKSLMPRFEEYMKKDRHIRYVTGLSVVGLACWYEFLEKEKIEL